MMQRFARCIFAFHRPPLLPMNRHGAVLALHGAVLLFGFAGLFGKWLELPPVYIVLGRTIVATAALAGLRALRRDALPPFDFRLVATGAALALHWVAFFAAIQVASVAIGLLGFASFPLFVLVLEPVMLGQRWGRREVVTALLVLAGLLLVVPDFSWADRTLQGLAWGLLSGLTFALLAVLNRRFAATRAAKDVALWQNACATLVLVPIAMAADSVPAFDARAIGLLVLLGVLCTAVAHTLFIGALRTVTAHTASVVAALEPVYGIALAFVLLDEVPGARTLAGGALIVGAAIYATRRAGSGTNP
jgi:drug/metabolite transporter (DMT)-like permease